MRAGGAPGEPPGAPVPGEPAVSLGGPGVLTVGGQAIPIVDAPPALDPTVLPTAPAPPLSPAPAPRPSGPRHAANGRRPATAGTAGVPHLDPPTAVTGQYLPALDGLRAFAVAGVIAYHLGLGWASGGYLGVDLFFVLSGFLITSLLLEEWVTTARIRLASFWARRARRLLPALFLVLVAIAAYVVLYGRFGPPGSASQVDLSALRGDALATLFYVANWHAIFAHQSYFAQFSTPSPLEHTWSLAIEEQFYLVWPPVLLGILTLSRGTWRRVGAAVTVVGALGSATLMALLYQPGADPTRLYFGTDTHLFDMLAGATVAMVAAARPQPVAWARTLLHVAAPVCAVALGVFWVVAGTPGGLPKGWMFQGGFLVCAGLAAVVVADARQFHLGPLGALLAVRPLRWIGMISYGIYLWHWPIFVYVNGARTGLRGAALDTVRIALTLAIAAASFYLVERPIRQRRMVGWPRFVLAPLVAAATAAVVVVATIPAVAAPSTVAPSTHAVRVGGRQAVPGAGGYQGQEPIAVPPFGPTDPLRVTVFGDSVPRIAEPAIAAALEATGEVAVTDGSATGFGLNRALPDYTWRTGIPSLVAADRTQLVLATWSWDNSCTPKAATPGYADYDCALQHPASYKQKLEEAVRLMLSPGGASGVIFMEFPITGPDAAAGETATNPLVAAKVAGERAWNAIVASLPAEFPGQVMYLPVGTSVLLGGRYTPWLPATGRPGAPAANWVRVRKTDGVHFCPSGAARYADALLADMTDIFHLRPASPGWSEESWTSDPVYDTPPDSCPDDHPPG